MLKLLLLCMCCAASVTCDRNLHPIPKYRISPRADAEGTTTESQIAEQNEELTAEYWTTQALNTLKEKLASTVNTNVAKNVIFFLGDGMSVPTVTATRIYQGNENIQLSFDKFPHTAVSKTYCVDYQVPDSACTSTAYLGGVKNNEGTIGVTAAVPRGDCTAMADEANHVQSIGKWFQDEGKSVGFVTTARVTDASPVGLYGHTAERHWESDTAITKDGQDAAVCKDLAQQLITGDVGSKLKVIMGGGRTAFLPMENKSYGDAGERSDKQDLIELWKNQTNGAFVSNLEELNNLTLTEVDAVLGLFANGHCPYHLQRDVNVDPSLSQMTEAAIKILSKNKQGYFLFVEGARIDMAHHEGKARLSLEDTAEFGRSIEAALNLTSDQDTLIVVTADHSHTLSISGYSYRKHNILGISTDTDNDKVPYTTLNYANGPGYETPDTVGGKMTRHDVSKDNLAKVDAVFPAGIPLASETHGGDDVIIYASGPWAHLFRGVLEQNVIPHIVGYAACVNPDGNTACKSGASKAGHVYTSVFVLITFVLLNVFM